MRGILFGLLYQVVVAVGFIWVAGVARNTNPIVKANLMLCVAGLVAFVVLLSFAAARSGEFLTLSRSDILKLCLGAVLVLVIGETVYISGLAASNATTMAYTALAFPAICLALDVFLQRIPLSTLSTRDYVGIAFLAIGFILISLRSSPVDEQSAGGRLPHEGVYARLGVSTIHGVGVFALRDISVGVNLFPNDPAKVRWVAKELVDGGGLPPALLRLYVDFSIFKNGKYGVPENFNQLRASWYLNEPAPGDIPNVRVDEIYNLFALRDIRAGEELTICDATFSEPINRDG